MLDLVKCDLRGRVSLGSSTSCSPLAYSFPEAEEFHIGEKTVKAGVSLTSLSHEASKGDHLGRASHFSFLIALHNTEDE